jgi:Ca2+/H+ antiporter
MEFACAVAGAKAVVVLGHTACGAVKGAIDDVELGNLTGLLARIKPAITATTFDGEKSSKNAAYVDTVARTNVVVTPDNLRRRSPILADLEKKGSVRVAGAMYDLATGKVEFITFTAVASLSLWAVFVFVQTIRHRDYFLPREAKGDESAHAAPPTLRQAWVSFALLLVSLVAVVGLAKVLSPAIEAAVDAVGAPPAVIGVAIAALVLLPESYAAVRAAVANRLQTSMNLALGSALACIGLTIPAVALASVLLDLPLVLGLDAKDLVLLTLTFVVSTITLGTGRTHVMQGAVHLVIFAAFLFLTLVP